MIVPNSIHFRIRLKTCGIFTVLLVALVMPKNVRSDNTKSIFNMMQQAQADLKVLLYTQKEWVKVHVAEFLVWENYLTDDVRTVFLDEERKYGDQPRYRIGVWRVLAQAALTSEERESWIGRIVAVYNDPSSIDRLHAIETLAKLGVPVDVSRERVTGIIVDDIDAFTIYRLWNAAHHPDVGPDIVRATCLQLLNQLTEQGNTDLIPTISYVLRYLKPFALNEWLQLPKLQTINMEPVAVRANLLATAWMTAPLIGDQQTLSIKNQLMSMEGDPAGLQQLLHGLAERGEAGDREMLFRLYDQVSDVNKTTYDADIHATAAYAMLKLMKISGLSQTRSAVIDEIKTISMEPHYYHGWSTVGLRKDGSLILVYSGGREDHICPFGRVQSMTSHDEGLTWTWPRVIMDSATDDRDAGVIETANGDLLVTFFTSIAYQKHLANPELRINKIFKEESAAHIERSLLAKERINARQEKEDVGFWTLRSEDGGLSWSARTAAPCYSPHGPTVMADGRLFYAAADGKKSGAWFSSDHGKTWDSKSALPIKAGEVHGIEAPDGTLVVHVRDNQAKVTVQTTSKDGGNSWSEPRVIARGYPSHLVKLDNGDLLVTYGVRTSPYGIRAKVSSDAGQSWSNEIVLYDKGIGSDLGYPSTVQLKSGKLITIWYEVVEGSDKAVLRQAVWEIK